MAPSRPAAAELAALLPDGVASACLLDFDAAGPLHPEEAHALGPVHPSRARAFRAGRHCARLALRRLGHPDAAGPIGVGQRRVPRWPPGVVGSISHTAGWSAAAVGPAARFAGIGIDVERRGRVRPALWRRVARPEERAVLESLPDPEPGASLLFCAKEAFFKAQFPRTGVELRFQDARVEVEGEELRLHLLRDLPGVPTRVRGRGRLLPEHCVVAFVLEAG